MHSNARGPHMLRRASRWRPGTVRLGRARARRRARAARGVAAGRTGRPRSGPGDPSRPWTPSASAPAPSCERAASSKTAARSARTQAADAQRALDAAVAPPCRSRYGDGGRRARRAQVLTAAAEIVDRRATAEADFAAALAAVHARRSAKRPSAPRSRPIPRSAVRRAPPPPNRRWRCAMTRSASTASAQLRLAAAERAQREIAAAPHGARLGRRGSRSPQPARRYGARARRRQPPPISLTTYVPRRSAGGGRRRRDGAPAAHSSGRFSLLHHDERFGNGPAGLGCACSMPTVARSARR